ncbi:MAG: phage tail tube protein [Bacteroidota bacterium]
MSTTSGTDLRFYINGTPIGHATNCTLDMTKEITETVSKDNIEGWVEKEGRQKSASLSFEGFHTNAATLNSVTIANAEDLFDAFDSDTLIVWRFTDAQVGNKEYTGNAIMSSLSFSAPVNENATHSGSMDVTGPVNKVDVPNP